MSVVQIISNLFALLAGIGVFLIAIKMIGDHLESVGGNNLRVLFAKTSKSNSLGVGIGTAATALVQSSGATSVMTIGFVSAGIMSVTQGCAIVLGANIGTTITAQIAAIGLLGGSATMSASTILAMLACVGAFMIFFGKKELVKQIGGLLAGFGLLFVGLSLMSKSMEPFAQLDSVKNFIAGITFPGYSVVLFLIGILITALMQSSSVTSSIAITLYMSGLINLDQGIYLILGSNIGAVVVAILACIGANYKAKRVACFHLITNIVRCVLFLAIVEIVIACGKNTFTLGSLFELIFPDNVAPLRLSMFHTFFNILTVVILTPLIPLFVKISEKIVKEDTEDGESYKKLVYIDEHMFKTPAIAVQQMKNEVINMAEIAMHNFQRSCRIIKSLDFDEKEEFAKREDQLNFLNKEIVKYNVKLSKLDLLQKDHAYVSTVFHTVTDIERIGDYAENIVEYAEKLQQAGEFSDTAIVEIEELETKIALLYDKCMKAYQNEDIKLYREAKDIEQDVDDITDAMAENHIKRLSDGTCQADIGAQFLSFTSDAERIADHWINVAKSIKSYAKVR